MTTIVMIACRRAIVDLATTRTQLASSSHAVGLVFHRQASARNVNQGRCWHGGSPVEIIGPEGRLGRGEVGVAFLRMTRQACSIAEAMRSGISTVATGVTCCFNNTNTGRFASRQVEMKWPVSNQ
ncbi:MAG: hypothetical protein U0744_00870 [Gemmataceae bacterium]